MLVQRGGSFVDFARQKPFRLGAPKHDNMHAAACPNWLAGVAFHFSKHPPQLRQTILDREHRALGYAAAPALSYMQTFISPVRRFH